MTYIFWSILAAFYLALSLVTIVVCRPIFKRFKEITETPMGNFLETESGRTIWIEGLFIRAFKAIIITDIIGFFVSAAAAVVSAIL